MITTIRNDFNNHFSEDKYKNYLAYLEKDFPGTLDFRIAETPVFVDKGFKEKMLSAGEAVIDKILSPEFKQLTQNAIPGNIKVAGDEQHPHFLILDFGICENGADEYEPMLVEMQAFPSLFAYQLHQYKSGDVAYNFPKNFTPFLNGYSEEKAIHLLEKILVGDNNPEHTILLEIFPDQQKTRIDFLYTKKYLGIETVCVTDLIKENRDLFYIKDGDKIKIERIYNRLIFDELHRQAPGVQSKAKILFDDLDVEWITHSNWFYRVSKYTLPFLKHPNVPETFFLKDLKEIPDDLENYVLKPLFSFAGNGVIIDVKKENIDEISDKENYILQKKVKYASAIKTPDENAKAEIRLFYFWEKGASRPVAAYNLARLTKGNMISVALNKNKTWVGGSFALFEE
ncbi:hypothetical protein A9P82_07905 [Arachidicoccus ginsenosidimutans]|uniref:hypothetical protein n=1 Tax=Arachidicoccus sp. BS20 TaxID=1850526 RepID=UPI0007F1117A|nr:hypothetical protein [Arachidicoccus sp. BS20]ANI89221.1 hypothetical protein A9P82_07905 [Arachidicoccus sp. BS20]